MNVHARGSVINRFGKESRVPTNQRGQLCSGGARSIHAHKDTPAEV